MSWYKIGTLNDLVLNSGICAQVNNQQVAVFYVPNDKQSVFAISNFDPIGKANVLARGIVGSLQAQLIVASPLYKQHFCLKTGQCLEAETIRVPVYKTKVEHDQVFISSQPVLAASSVS